MFFNYKAMERMSCWLGKEIYCRCLISGLMKRGEDANLIVSTAIQVKQLNISLKSFQQKFL